MAGTINASTVATGELALNLRIKPKRSIKRDKPDALSVPEAINQVWSMDFYE